MNNSRLIVIGNYGVGKSSIVNWIRYNKPLYPAESTIGASFLTMTLSLDGRSRDLSIWDTAGQERFRSLVRSYYKRVDICLCVFDVTDKESFNSLHYWINDYHDHCGDTIGSMYVIANKCDADIGRWAISEEEIASICRLYHCNYYKTNCIKGDGIDQLLLDITQQLIEKDADVEEDNIGYPVIIESETPKSSSNCC